LINRTASHELFLPGLGLLFLHLLLAYLVDHVSIHLAFLICSAVSVFLVVSYLRLVVGARFAIVEAGGAQFISLLFFLRLFPSRLHRIGCHHRLHRDAVCRHADDSQNPMGRTVSPRQAAFC
jgi:hypothetical protein